MTDEMRASILAHENMLKVMLPLMTPDSLRRFIREEQKRIEEEKHKYRGDGAPR